MKISQSVTVIISLDNTIKIMMNGSINKYDFMSKRMLKEEIKDLVFLGYQVSTHYLDV